MLDNMMLPEPVIYVIKNEASRLASLNFFFSMTGDIQGAAGLALSISFRSCVTRRWVHKAGIHVGESDHSAGNLCTTLSSGFPFREGNRIFF